MCNPREHLYGIQVAGETLSEDRAPGIVGSLVGLSSFSFGHKEIATQKLGV